MKANETPEKIYITHNFQRRWFTKEIDEECIEYVRKDAFIEKAKKWFEKQNEWFDLDGVRHCDLEDFDDFRKYMEGE